MVKKSKANRKTAPVETSSIAATAAATTTTTTTTAIAVANETELTGKLEEFPESTFFVKGESFRRKGNYSKATKVYLQGIENGCVRCMYLYTMKILSDGAAIENMTTYTELINNNTNLHLALPFLLEGAIRGNYDAIMKLGGVYCEARHATEDDVIGIGRYLPAAPLILYWKKHASQTKEDRTRIKQVNKGVKENYGSTCSVCRKYDSETVTLLKCDGCKFYYYCSKECQKKMWVEGQHAGVCRQLGVLRQYHKPFATKIRMDLVVHRMAPKDVPELQELRDRLGLSRSQADYQDVLEAAQAQHFDSASLIFPRKDGTVQLGSFPRPI